MRQNKAIPIGDSRRLVAQLGMPAPSPVLASNCLFRQGEEACDAFYLSEGTAKLVRNRPKGGGVIIGLRGPGQFVGVEAAILGRYHLVSAVTLTECRVSRLPAGRFRDLIRAIPELSWHLHQKHCEELYLEAGHIGDLGTLSARERLLQFLDWLHRGLARDRELATEVRVHVPLKQWEIAQLLAITPPYLCGLIAELERDGILRRDGPMFIIRRGVRADSQAQPLNPFLSETTRSSEQDPCDP